LRSGPIDPDNFTPDPKNPRIAEFFVNIGFADTLGSGVRNLYKYTQVYSGQDPQLIDGDTFKTITPLALSVTQQVTERGTDGVTEGEAAVIRLIGEEPAMTQAAMVARLSVSRKTVAARLLALKGRG